MPSDIIPKILYHEKVHLVKSILSYHLKIYDLEEDGSFKFAKTSSNDVRLQNINSHSRFLIRNKRDLQDKHIIYFLYKNKQITWDKREDLIEKLKDIVDFSNFDVLTILIQMKDEDMVEYKK